MGPPTDVSDAKRGLLMRIGAVIHLLSVPAVVEIGYLLSADHLDWWPELVLVGCLLISVGTLILTSVAISCMSLFGVAL
jgi:hypothetical protein